MAEMLYCPNCKRNVDVSKWTGGRIAILVILLILGIIFGIVYLIYVLAQTQKCPTCGTPDIYLERPKFNNASVNTSTGVQKETIYCTGCGAANKSDSKFCNECGVELKKE